MLKNFKIKYEYPLKFYEFLINKRPNKNNITL